MCGPKMKRGPGILTNSCRIKQHVTFILDHFGGSRNLQRRKWALPKTSMNSPMSYENAYASAYATLSPLQFLPTRGICWFRFPLQNWITQASATQGFAYESLLWHNSFNSHKGRFERCSSVCFWVQVVYFPRLTHFNLYMRRVLA